MRVKPAGWSIALSFLLLSLTAWGQRTTATLAGTVTDSAGAVVPGATVVMTSENTKAAITQTTNDAGEFVFASVPADAYSIKVTREGFKTSSVNGMILSAGQNARRAFALELGDVVQSVTVTDAAPIVNALTTEQRTGYDTLEVESVPMANRNISKVLEQTPGITRDASAAGNYGGRVRLNGLGGSAVSITANGTNASGNSGTPGLSQWQQFNKIDVMSVESVAEVQVVKGVVAAEYGPYLAGNVNFITKGGSNTWHGSAFYRYEGARFDAKNFFVTTKPNQVWNQYGGSFGGPIKKNKLFFFSAFEGYRQHAPQFLSGSVPTQSFRDAIQAALPFVETSQLLNTLPLPNQPFVSGSLLGVWTGSRGLIAADDHFDERVDLLQFGGNLSLVYTHGHPSLTQPVVQQGNTRTFTSQTDRASVSYVVGRSKWTSDSRFGYNENQLVRTDAFSKVKDTTRTEIEPYQLNAPVLNFSGMTSTNAEVLSRGHLPTLSWEQQFSLIRGNHTFKYGGFLMRQAGTRLNGVNSRVSFQTLAQIQANTPSQVAEQYTANPYYWHSIQYGFFIQDDWRVSPRLVVNLGIRYDVFGRTVARPQDPKNPAGYFDRDILNTTTFALGPVRSPEDPWGNDPNNFSPRFGFNYQVDPKGNTVLRGGFGIMFESIDPYTIEQSVSNPLQPYSYTFTPAEINTYHMKWPRLYNQDTLPLVSATTQDQITNPLIPHNLQSPYAMNFTLGIQRAINSNLVFETAFVGTRGVKYLLIRTYNEQNRQTGIRPNPAFGSSTYMDNDQQTNYYSSQSSLRERLTHHLTFQANYTYGKALSYNGGDISKGSTGDATPNVQDFNSVRAEYGYSTGDVKHLIVGQWVYQAPTPAFAKNLVARTVLGGWNLAGSFRFNTGVPIDITETTAGASARPDRVNGVNAVNKCCSVGNLQYLNPAAFFKIPIIAASGETDHAGNLSHNAYRGPKYTTLDLSLAKDFPLSMLREGANLQARADSTNSLNHTNYDTVTTLINAANFGQVTSTKTARSIQFQLRLSF